MRGYRRTIFNALTLASLLVCATLLLAWAATGNAHLHKGRLNLQYHKVVPLTAILPVIWFGHWVWQAARRQDRLMFGLCPECGYDLRASKNNCPECGSPVRSTATLK